MTQCSTLWSTVNTPNNNNNDHYYHYSEMSVMVLPCMSFEQLQVQCLAQGHLSNAPEVNWHFSSLQSTLHTTSWTWTRPLYPTVTAFTKELQCSNFLKDFLNKDRSFSRFTTLVGTNGHGAECHKQVRRAEVESIDRMTYWWFWTFNGFVGNSKMIE